MKITAAGVALIKTRENCKLVAYRCPAGVWTIGYGHTGPEVHDGLTILQEEAEALLLADLIVFDSAVLRSCPNATPAQHAAMVDLAYNIGCGAFAKSSVCRLHNAGRYAEAAQAFALWNKAGGKVLAGLVSRRAAEAALYLSDAPTDNAPSADGEKPLSQSRNVNGNALAGTATAVGLGGKLVQQVEPNALQQLVDALGPLAPYASWIGTAIVLVTLAGIGMGFYARWHDRHTGRA